MLKEGVRENKIEKNNFVQYKKLQCMTKFYNRQHKNQKTFVIFVHYLFKISL